MIEGAAHLEPARQVTRKVNSYSENFANDWFRFHPHCFGDDISGEMLSMFTMPHKAKRRRAQLKLQAVLCGRQLREAYWLLLSLPSDWR